MSLLKQCSGYSDLTEPAEQFSLKLNSTEEITPVKTVDSMGMMPLLHWHNIIPLK